MSGGRRSERRRRIARARWRGAHGCPRRRRGRTAGIASPIGRNKELSRVPNGTAGECATCVRRTQWSLEMRLRPRSDTDQKYITQTVYFDTALTRTGCSRIWPSPVVERVECPGGQQRHWGDPSRPRSSEVAPPQACMGSPARAGRRRARGHSSSVAAQRWHEPIPGRDIGPGRPLLLRARMFYCRVVRPSITSAWRTLRGWTGNISTGPGLEVWESPHTWSAPPRCEEPGPQRQPFAARPPVDPLAHPPSWTGSFTQTSAPPSAPPTWAEAYPAAPQPPCA